MPSCAWNLVCAIRRVSIIPDQKADTLGHCRNTDFPKWFRPDNEVGFRERQWLEMEILIFLGGLAAEFRFTCRRDFKGANADFHAAVDLASYSYDGLVLNRFLAYMTERTKALIHGHIVWLNIEAVAEALLEHRTLSGKRVREICREAIQAGPE